MGTAASAAAAASPALTAATLAALSAAYFLRRSPDAEGRAAPLPAPLAAALCAPAVAAALTDALLAAAGGGALAGALARAAAPAAAAALAAHAWSGGGRDVARAAAAEARALARALAGTGVSFAAALVAGHHTVVFFRADAPVAADAPFAPGAPPPLVLLAGYGGGAAWWLANAAALAKAHAGRVVAVDWRGTGASPRPRWAARGARAAEDFFLDGLAAWRAALGAPPAVLCGHSLGGALALAAWARDPAGVAGVVALSPAALAPGLFDAGGGGARAPRVPRALRALASFLWDAGVTPGALVRALGPFGPRAVAAALRRRAARWTFAQPLPDGALDALGAYLFHTLAAPGSGEHALRHLLAPGAAPRAPLLPRLAAALDARAVGGAGAAGGVRGADGAPRAPFAFAYGDGDWMPASGGAAAVDLLRAAGFQATHHVVEAAGHHLYLENPAATNDIILGVAREALRAAAAAARGAEGELSF